MTDKLTAQEAERDQFRNQVREECKIRINEMRIDIETEKSNNATLTERLNELQRQTGVCVLPPPTNRMSSTSNAVFRAFFATEPTQERSVFVFPVSVFFR